MIKQIVKTTDPAMRNLMRLAHTFAGLLTLCCILGCQSRSAIQAEKRDIDDRQRQQAISMHRYHVYKVIDGDTFWVKNVHGQQIKVRLIGVDAPETRNAFHKRKHPLGKACKEYLADLIANRDITLAFDVDSLDRYGRTLAYAYLSNGIFVNENILRNGYGVMMTIPPNVQFVDAFREAQEKAREEEIGLWKIYRTEDEIDF